MVTQTFAEILLFTPAALTTGFVLFLPTVIQRIMDELNEAEFKRLLTLLTKYALKSAYAISVSTITFIGMIPYWYFYGLSNTWFSAGLVTWIIASTVSKYTTLPIYSRVTGRSFPGFKKLPEIKISDKKALREECGKLRKANVLRAALCALSTALMLVGLA